MFFLEIDSQKRTNQNEVGHYTVQYTCVYLKSNDKLRYQFMKIKDTQTVSKKIQLIPEIKV